MSAKDYEAIAAILQSEGMDPDNRDGAQAVAERLSAYFAATNPGFKPAQFMHAAGSCNCALRTDGCEWVRRTKTRTR